MNERPDGFTHERVEEAKNLYLAGAEYEGLDETVLFKQAECLLSDFVAYMARFEYDIVLGKKEAR